MNVKNIEVGESDELVLDLKLTDELIKEGTLRNLMREIQDKRKELGLSPKDLVELKLSVDEKFFGSVLNEQLKLVCKTSVIYFSSLAESEKVSFEVTKV